jgi:hypothetical protein
MKYKPEQALFKECGVNSALFCFGRRFLLPANLPSLKKILESLRLQNYADLKGLKDL